ATPYSIAQVLCGLSSAVSGCEGVRSEEHRSGFLIVPLCSAAARGFARASRGACGALAAACAQRLGAGARPEWGIAKELVMTLKIYSVVLELVRRVAPVVQAVRRRSLALGDQLERALMSVPLSIA